MTALIKTLTFAAVHFSVAFTVAYLLTGSIAISGALALVEPLCNTVAYFFHEKVWNAVGHSHKAA
jgi:Predicted membrane protein